MRSLLAANVRFVSLPAAHAAEWGSHFRSEHWVALKTLAQGSRREVPQRWESGAASPQGSAR
jgi:hypothetical protein